MKLIENYGIEILSGSEQKRLGIEMPLGKASEGKTTYDIITNLVIELIDKADLPPWQKPWSVNKSGDRNFPMNFETKRAYSGVNNFLLTMLMDIKKHKCPYFLTFKQLEKLKGKIKKGAKAYPICFYANDLYRDAKGKTITKSVWEKLSEIEKQNYSPSFVLKYYNAFNAEDIEGIEFGTNWEPRELPKKEQIESCETILSGMPNKPGIKHGGSSAHYSPSGDYVQMPLMEYFEKEQFYYSVIFHELIHATGSKTRLDRKFGSKFGDSNYAFEELVAEMGACYLCGEAGILYHNLKNSATYIKGWKSNIKSELQKDNKFFFKACADAQRGADYILGKSDPLVYAKFPKDNSEVFDQRKVIKGTEEIMKTSKGSKNLELELSTVKDKVIQNAQFKEKIAAELKAFLSTQGLSGINSETDRIKRKIKFYKNIIKGDNADFKAIAKRVGYTYSISKPRASKKLKS